MSRKQPKRATGKSAPPPARPATEEKKEEKKKTAGKAAPKKPEPTAPTGNQRRSSRATTAAKKAEKPKPPPLACKKNMRRKKIREPDLKKYAKLVATLPKCVDKSLADEEERDEPIWVNPPNFFEDSANVDAVHKYVTGARMNAGMGIDRALYNLLKNDYDIPAATEAVANIVAPLPIAWSEMECEIFRRCFAAYGKNFRKIQEVMSDRTLPDVIAHYYNSKPKEQYKSSANNIGPDEVDFGDSDDDGDVRNGNCQLCTKERTLFNCNGDLICNSCRLFKDEMEDFFEELDYYDKPESENELPREPNPCPIAWEVTMKEALTGRFHDPITKERFEELKEKELERVKALIKNFNESGGDDSLEEVLRDKPKQYGVFFMNQKVPPTKCQTEIRLLRNETYDRIVRIRKQEAALEQEMADLEPMMASIEASKVAYNKKKKSEPKPPRVRYSAQWSKDEMRIAFISFLRYGLDYKAVSAIVRTKTADMCKVWYDNNKKAIGPRVEQREKELSEGIDEIANRMEVL